MSARSRGIDIFSGSWCEADSKGRAPGTNGRPYTFARRSFLKRNQREREKRHERMQARKEKEKRKIKKRKKKKRRKSKKGKREKEKEKEKEEQKTTKTSSAATLATLAQGGALSLAFSFWSLVFSLQGCPQTANFFLYRLNSVESCQMLQLMAGVSSVADGLGSPRSHAGDAAQQRRRQHPLYESRLQQSLRAKHKADVERTTETSSTTSAELLEKFSGLDGHNDIQELLALQKRAGQEKVEAGFLSTPPEKSFTIRIQNLSTNSRGTCGGSGSSCPASLGRADGGQRDVHTAIGG